MSSALVRQALALVDPEENKSKEKKRRANPTRQLKAGQVSSNPVKPNSKKQRKAINKSKEKLVQENIKKLLALSAPTADSAIAEKIVERAVKGKPLAEKIDVKVDEVKSILFPDEPFDEFEKSYFCR